MQKKKHGKTHLFDKTHYWFDSLYESKNPTACLIKAVKHTCILQQILNKLIKMPTPVWRKHSKCPRKRSCNRKSVEYVFSNQVSVQITIKFMFMLTVTSLARAVLCDDIGATRQNVKQMTHLLGPQYKVCNHFLAWKYKKWCWTEWSVSTAGGKCWFG